MHRSSEGGDKHHPYVGRMLHCSTLPPQLWTSLTNYEHIGPREISNAPIIPALTPMPVIISIYPRYIFYVNVQHKAKIAQDTQIRKFSEACLLVFKQLTFIPEKVTKTGVALIFCPMWGAWDRYSATKRRQRAMYPIWVNYLPWSVVQPCLCIVHDQDGLKSVLQSRGHNIIFSRNRF